MKVEDDPVDEFIARVDRLEQRYKGEKHADMWMMPADLVKAVRDELKRQRCPDTQLTLTFSPPAGTK